MKPEIFIDLYKDYLRDFYTNSKDEVKTYKEHHVLAVDGSMFKIPNTKELREIFKTQKNNSGHRESARARVSGIYDIENEFIIDAIIADCEQGEKNLAKKNVTEAGKIIDLTKSIIIFDRGYPGIDLIWFLEKIGAKYIFRLQSTNMYEKKKKTDDYNKVFSPKTLRKQLNHFQKKANIPHTKFKDLRSSHGTFLLSTIILLMKLKID